MPDPDTILDVISRILDSMDDIFSVIFMLMVVFTFLEGSINKKKRPPPTPDFDIPTLENDPTIEVQQVEPPPRIVPRGVTNNITESYRQKYRLQRLAEESSLRTKKPTEDQAKEAALDADDALNAMILSEIFDKPKALRRR